MPLTRTRATSSDCPAWLEEACELPLGFAQVREDALQDLWVVDHLGVEARVIMVASGGCTAAALAASSRVSCLHLVDPNPAQIALSRLKLRLLRTMGVLERLAVLGHAPMPPTARQARLAAEFEALGLASHALGPTGLVAEMGPDHSGRYECVFAELRRALCDHTDEIHALLQLHDPTEQARRIAPVTGLGRALDDAFDRVMSLPNLVLLFGDGATRNRVESFSRHFARRTRHLFATLPAEHNPYLWQMLRGQFPANIVSPWLAAPPPRRMPRVTWENTSMGAALRFARGKFDFVHLSNILDWLATEDAVAVLELAWAALRPGGAVLIRQLNSTLDIPILGEQFQWEAAQANALHMGDRSFFYRGLYLGRKR